jgi:hypothetical protein
MSAQIIYPTAFRQSVHAEIETSNLSDLTPAQVGAVKSLRRTALLMRDGDARAHGFLATLATAIGCHPLADSAAKLLAELTGRQTGNSHRDGGQGGAA